MKITATQLKKHLDSCSQEELISQLLELYAKCESVKDFYSVKLAVGGAAALLEKYKKIIKNEFLPDRGDGKLRMSVAKKAIADFKQYSPSSHDIADIMVYYVEMGMCFIDEYGDISESACNSIESMYESVLKFIVKNKLQKEFKKRCLNITKHKKADCWGLNDSLEDVYDEFFGESAE